MPDVTIPENVAKDRAQDLRAHASVNRTSLPVLAETLDAVADLLDPRPLSLREQVKYAISVRGYAATADDLADAALAVVADAPIEQIIALVGPRLGDWLAAQPYVRTPPGAEPWDFRRVLDRDATVALIRGGAS